MIKVENKQLEIEAQLNKAETKKTTIDKRYNPENDPLLGLARDMRRARERRRGYYPPPPKRNSSE